MIGLDTNILLRALLDDDAVQSPAARKCLAALDEGRRGYVGVAVMLELFWVLKSRYGVPRLDLAETMRDVLTTENIEFESFDAMTRALAMFEKAAVDFPDALLAERNLEAGCSTTFTLDKAAAKAIYGMELPA